MRPVSIYRLPQHPGCIVIYVDDYSLEVSLHEEFNNRRVPYETAESTNGFFIIEDKHDAAARDALGLHTLSHQIEDNA